MELGSASSNQSLPHGPVTLWNCSTLNELQNHAVSRTWQSRAGPAAGWEGHLKKPTNQQTNKRNTYVCQVLCCALYKNYLSVPQNVLRRHESSGVNGKNTDWSHLDLLNQNLWRWGPGLWIYHTTSKWFFGMLKFEITVLSQVMSWKMKNREF